MTRVGRVVCGSVLVSLTAVALVVLTACSSSGEVPAPTLPASVTAHAKDLAPRSTGPSRTPTADDLEAVEKAQTAISSAGSIRIQGELSLAGEKTRIDVISSPDGSEWKGTFSASKTKVSVLHTDATTWVSAPTDYWKAAGIPADVAKRAGAQGKYLAFTREAGSAVVSYADMTSFLQTLRLLDPSAISAVSRAANGEGDVFTVPAGAATNWLVVSRGEHPVLRSLAADNANGTASSVELTLLTTPQQVDPPAATSVVPLALDSGH